MTNTFTRSLDNKFGIDIRKTLEDVLFDFISEVTNNKNKFIDTILVEVLGDMTQNRLTSNGNQGFRLSMSMRTKTGSYTCNGNNSFHVLFDKRINMNSKIRISA